MTVIGSIGRFEPTYKELKLPVIYNTNAMSVIEFWAYL